MKEDHCEQVERTKTWYIKKKITYVSFMLSILKCASALGFPFKRQRLTGNIFFKFSFDYILLTRVFLDPTTPKSKRVKKGYLKYHPY